MTSREVTSQHDATWNDISPIRSYAITKPHKLMMSFRKDLKYFTLTIFSPDVTTFDRDFKVVDDFVSVTSKTSSGSSW